MEFIQQNLLLVAVAIVSGSLLLFTSLRRPGGGNTVSSTQATMLINRENALVIDIREAGDYAAGHLPDARNIPADRIEERAGDFGSAKEAPVIVVCQSGARADAACKTLQKLGFTKVHSLEGGINAWRQAGLPLKKGKK